MSPSVGHQRCLLVFQYHRDESYCPLWPKTTFCRQNPTPGEPAWAAAIICQDNCFGVAGTCGSKREGGETVRWCDVVCIDDGPARAMVVILVARQRRRQRSGGEARIRGRGEIVTRFTLRWSRVIFDTWGKILYTVAYLMTNEVEWATNYMYILFSDILLVKWGGGNKKKDHSARIKF